MTSASTIIITARCNGDGGGSRGGYIEHTISKLDTLAGVAIKYGVEVADIKRMNGLVTDLQMFALKSLQIPLPGRHPPVQCPIESVNYSPLSNESSSPGISNPGTTPYHLGGSRQPDSSQPRRLKSSPQKLSPAMSTLHNFYCLKTPNPKGLAKGAEKAAYRKSDNRDNKLSPASSLSDPLLNGQHKPRLLPNGFLAEIERLARDIFVKEEEEDGEGDRNNENSVRQWSKSETDYSSGTPERLLKEENGSSSFLPVTGKNIALRPKSVGRTASIADAAGWFSSNTSGLGELLSAKLFAKVLKSSSLSSIQDEGNSYSSSSLWSQSKWSLKSDLQSLSTSSLAKPLLDGLPINGRRNKAALDNLSSFALWWNPIRILVTSSPDT